MLPDIDQQDWDEYERQQLQQTLQQKAESFNLQHVLQSKVSDVQSLFGSQAEEAPPPPPPPPAPEPVPEPSPEPVQAAPPPTPEPAPTDQPAPDLSRIGSWAGAPPPTLPADFDFSQPLPAPAPEPAPDTSSTQPAPASAPVSAPPSAPPPSLSSDQGWMGNVIGAGMNAVTRAGGDVDAFTNSFTSRLGQGVTESQDIIGHALNAAQGAGADIDQFIQGFNLPSRPTVSPPGAVGATGAPATSVGGVPDWLSSLIAQNAPAQLANDPDFIRTVAAGSKAESGWDVNRIQNGFTLGSGKGARGLFQFDMGGMGSGIPEEQLLGQSGAQLQASRIVPLYAQAYQNAPAGLTGAEKASWVAAQAERPYQYQDPNSAARRNYATAYNDIGAGDMLSRTGGWAQPHAPAPPQQSVGSTLLPTGPADDGGRVFPLPFQPDNQPSATYHSQGGSDLMAPRGTPVAAMQSGKVLETFVDKGDHQVGGNAVLIHGDDGLDYYYAHFDAPTTLKKGDSVQAGQQIGAVGNSGNAYKDGTGATHLHIGIGHGISNGVGSEGGLGENYNAQALLNGLEQGVPTQREAGGVQGILNRLGQAKDAVIDRLPPMVGFGNNDSSNLPTFGPEDLAAAPRKYSDAMQAVPDESATGVRLAPGSPGGPPDYTNYGVAAAQATAGRPSGLDQLVADTVTTPHLTGLGDDFQQGRRDLGSAIAGADLGDVPVLSGLGELGAQALGGILEQPSALDALQTLGDLNNKYADTPGALTVPMKGQAPLVLSVDPNQMSDADAQAYKQSMFILGAVGGPMDVEGGAGNAAARAAGRAEPVEAAASRARSAAEAATAGETTTTPTTPIRTPRAPFAEDPAPVSPTGPWDPATSSNPAIRAVGRMYDEANQVAPESQQGSLLQRFVRAMTNRYEAADRYANENLRRIGADVNNPPENLDLRSLIREANGDAAAEVRVNRDLKPAVQAAGEEQAALKQVLTHKNNISTGNALADQILAKEADNPIPSHLTEALNRAKSSLDMRQRNLDALLDQSEQDPGRIAGAKRQVQGAQRTVANRQAAVDAARQEVLDQAARTAQDVRDNRAFSGGLRISDSEGALQDLERELGPARWEQVNNSARQIYRFLDGLRETLVDGGIIDRDTADLWKRQYPDWVPTKILDYMSDGAESGALRPGTKISLADDGIRRYTEEGTSKFREDPIASIIGLAHDVETRSRRNKLANAFVDLDGAARSDADRQLVPTDRPSKANEPIIQRIKDGTVERYIAPPELASAINGPVVEHAPGFTRRWTDAMRNLTTVLSPAFALVRNPSLDVPEFFTKVLGQELEGPNSNTTAVPRMVAALARGYGDAFQGLLQGEYRGERTQRYLEGGGGGSTLTGRDVASRAEAARDLLKPTVEFNGVVPTRESLQKVGAYMVDNRGDLQDVLKQIATLRPLRNAWGVIPQIAERTELGPRLAAMELAEKRGATPARATLNGRQVTLDFNEGGTLAKTINSFIPFFNASIQGSAQVARSIRDNPRGALASAGMTVGAPAMMAEAWNNSDPQRAQDYADVASYLKNQGIVVMLPGEAPVDADGNRHPQYWWFNTRGWAPMSNLARTAAHQALESTVGTPTTTDWGQALKDMVASGSPIRANSPEDISTALTPQFLPGLDTAAQLRSDKDVFRNRQIATQRNDENAAQLSKEIAGALTSMGRAIDPSVTVRPSQVDFAIRNGLTGVGNTLLGARELLPGAEPDTRGRAELGAPVLGGALQALGLRNTGGELGQQARQDLISDDMRRYLQANGVEWTPSSVQAEINKFPLNNDEETRYQQLANKYVDQRLREMQSSGELDGMTSDLKLKYIQRQVDNARKQASADVLDSIPDDEYNRRLDAAIAKREAGVR